MNTEPLLTGTTGPGSVAGRSALTRISVLLPLLLLLVFPALAQAQFSYFVEDGTVTITGYTGPRGDVVIPDTILGLPVTAIGSYAFNYREDLTNVLIPESVTSIMDFAFGWCTGLTSITIPNNVTNIGSGAWYGCSGLSDVFIPSSVTSMDGGAFGECSNLTAIVVDALNPSYSSLDGVLFDRDRTTLMWYPASKAGEYTIPDGVTVIVEII